MPAKNVVVVCNCASGSGQAGNMQAAITSAFAQHGVEPGIIDLRPGVDIAAEVQRAIAAGATTVVAGGGDGTMNAVAGALAGTDVAMGVLPLGTLNHFAKDLGIPLELPEAVATVVSGDITAVDLGEVNGRVFVNNSSIGLYPHLVTRREAHQRLGRRKWSAFVRAFLTVLGRYPFLRVRLSTDAASFVRKTPLIFIGNNQYEVHGLRLGTRQRLDQGALAVYLTREVGRLQMAMFCFRALFGRLSDHQDFETLTTRELSIVTTRKRTMKVATDGEVSRMDLPLEYRIRPQALRVRVPKAPA